MLKNLKLSNKQTIIYGKRVRLAKEIHRITSGPHKLFFLPFLISFE